MTRDAPNGADEVPEEADLLVPPTLLRVKGIGNRLVEEILVVASAGSSAQTPYPVAGERLETDEVGFAEGLQSRPDLIRGRRALIRYLPWLLLQPRLLRRRP